MNQVPIDVNDLSWLYVEEEGVRLVHEIRDVRCRYVTTRQMVIPWEAIEMARRQREAQLGPSCPVYRAPVQR